MKILLLLILFIKEPLFAGTFCEQIIKQKEVPTRGLSTMWDLMKYNYMPGTLVDVDSNSMTKVVTQGIPRLNSMKKNIIFSFGLDEVSKKKITEQRMNQFEELKQDKLDYYENMRDTRDKLEKILRRKCLIRRKTVSSRINKCIKYESAQIALSRCEQKEKMLNIDYSVIRNINKKMTMFLDITQLHESRRAKKLLEKSIKKSILKWEIIDVMHVKELHRILNSDNIGNIIIVNHGSKSNGSIVDSYGNDIRVKTFLRTVSSSLKSISFFSCFSHLIIPTYGLEDKFKKINNPPRIFFVREQEFLGKKGFTILKTLPTFIKQLENKIIDLPDYELSEPLNKKMCTLSLPNLNIIRGEVEVSLNHNFIGVVSSSRHSNGLSFNCKHLKKHGNMLYITGISPELPLVSNTNDQVLSLFVENGEEVKVREASSAFHKGKLFNLKFEF